MTKMCYCGDQRKRLSVRCAMIRCNCSLDDCVASNHRAFITFLQHLLAGWLAGTDWPRDLRILDRRHLDVCGSSKCWSAISLDDPLPRYFTFSSHYALSALVSKCDEIGMTIAFPRVLLLNIVVQFRSSRLEFLKTSTLSQNDNSVIIIVVGVVVIIYIYSAWLSV